MTSCRSPSVAGAGVCTRRQHAGRTCWRTILSWYVASSSTSSVEPSNDTPRVPIADRAQRPSGVIRRSGESVTAPNAASKSTNASAGSRVPNPQSKVLYNPASTTARLTALVNSAPVGTGSRANTVSASPPISSSSDPSSSSNTPARAAAKPRPHSSSTSSGLAERQLTRADRGTARPPSTDSSPAAVHGQCTAGTSAALRTHPGNSIPSARPAADTSDRRSTPLAVSGRPAPTHNASAAAPRNASDSRAEQARPSTRSSLPTEAE